MSCLRRNRRTETFQCGQMGKERGKFETHIYKGHPRTCPIFILHEAQIGGLRSGMCLLYRSVAMTETIQCIQRRERLEVCL